MYKLGLIGYPLSHSISGVIQKAGLESLNLEIKQKNLVPFDNYEIVDFKED